VIEITRLAVGVLKGCLCERGVEAAMHRRSYGDAALRLRGCHESYGTVDRCTAADEFLNGFWDGPAGTRGVVRSWDREVLRS
jgi:hypothetical protein